MPRPATPGLFFRLLLITAGPFLLFSGLLTGHAQPAGPESKSPKSDQKQGVKYERPTDPSLYVGSETCKTCHEDMPVKGFFKHFEDSPHFGPLWIPRRARSGTAAKGATARVKRTLTGAEIRQKSSRSKRRPRGKSTSATWTATRAAHST